MKQAHQHPSHQNESAMRRNLTTDSYSIRISMLWLYEHSACWLNIFYFVFIQRVVTFVSASAHTRRLVESQSWYQSQACSCTWVHMPAWHMQCQHGTHIYTYACTCQAGITPTGSDAVHEYPIACLYDSMQWMSNPDRSIWMHMDLQASLAHPYARAGICSLLTRLHILTAWETHTYAGQPGTHSCRHVLPSQLSFIYLTARTPMCMHRPAWLTHVPPCAPLPTRSPSCSSS